MTAAKHDHLGCYEDGPAAARLNTDRAALALSSGALDQGDDFFSNSPSGFPSAAHMLDSRLWFEEGKDQSLELRFACRPQFLDYLCFCMKAGFLLFRHLEVVRGRSVYVAIGWHQEPPQGLDGSVGWLDAGGPLPEAPPAGAEGGSSHV